MGNEILTVKSSNGIEHGNNIVNGDIGLNVMNGIKNKTTILGEDLAQI
jgi:hypothetical protein